MVEEQEDVESEPYTDGVDGQRLPYLLPSAPDHKIGFRQRCNDAAHEEQVRLSQNHAKIYADAEKEMAMMMVEKLEARLKAVVEQHHFAQDAPVPLEEPDAQASKHKRTLAEAQQEIAILKATNTQLLMTTSKGERALREADRIKEEMAQAEKQLVVARTEAEQQSARIKVITLRAHVDSRVRRGKSKEVALEEARVC